MLPLADIRADQQSFVPIPDQPGEAAERLVAQALNGQRLCVQAGRWCPDVEFEGGFVEVKQIQWGRQLTFLQSQIDAFRERDDYFLAVVIDNLVLFMPAKYVRRWMRSNLTDHLHISGRTIYHLPWRMVKTVHNSRNASRGRVDLDGRLVRWFSLCDVSFPWWPESYQEAAETMLDDLVQSQHRVVVQDCCRVVVETNPEWYRDLCDTRRTKCRLHQKKPSTDIRRSDAIKFLQKMIRGVRTRQDSEDLYLPAVQQAMKEYEEFVEPLAMEFIS